MKFSLILCLLLWLCSCAAPIRNLQPQINSLVIAHHFDAALRYLDDSPAVYGPKNELLYWLDKGMVFHLAGRYQESIDAFEQAKKKFDELYTRSLHEMASTYFVNDYWESYRGDDEEYVLLNVIDALNFAALGQIHESLVEARDVDVKLSLINGRYGPNNKNVYRDDAFARLLMGILYQADSSLESKDDARISLDRALQVYQKDYAKNYGISVPPLLDKIKNQDTTSQAIVYLIQYTGFMPIKTADVFVIPAGGALVTKLSFPKYVDRMSSLARSSLIAHGHFADTIYPTEVGENIGAIAKQILENRKWLLRTKAVLRPAVKLAGEKVAEIQLKKKYGYLSADALDILGTVYNFYTEEPDLRSWQTLPNEIRIARLVLNPGHYQFAVQSFDKDGNQLENKDLGSLDLKQSDVKFFIVRSYF